MILDIRIDAGNWPEEVSSWAEEVAGAIGLELDVPAASEVSILLTDDAHIRQLNADFRGKDKATNVLSWPSMEFEREEGAVPQRVGAGDEFLGDLAFGYETCENEAQSVGLDAHFKHLLIHGILHLLGYDHENDKDAHRMEALEVQALARLNIGNPYE